MINQILVAQTATVTPPVDAWTAKTVMPTERFLHSASAISGLIYNIGGLSKQPGGTVLDVNEAFNISGNSWGTLASITNPRYAHLAVVYSGDIFVFGGIDGGGVMTSCETYDVSMDSWSSITSLPTGGQAIGGVVGTKAYIVVGTDLYEYDFAGNSYSMKTSMPAGVDGPCAAVAGGKLYVIGNVPSTPTPILYEYDPSGNSWASKTAFRNNNSASAVTLSGKIHRIGGTLFGYSPQNVHDVYNPATDTWDSSLAALPFQAVWTASAESGGKIYTSGGDLNLFDPALDYNYEYSP